MSGGIGKRWPSPSEHGARPDGDGFALARLSDDDLRVIAALGRIGFARLPAWVHAAIAAVLERARRDGVPDAPTPEPEADAIAERAEASGDLAQLAQRRPMRALTRLLRRLEPPKPRRLAPRRADAPAVREGRSRSRGAREKATRGAPGPRIEAEDAPAPRPEPAPAAEAKDQPAERPLTTTEAEWERVSEPAAGGFFDARGWL